MRRFDAINAILDSLADDDIALFTTGMIGREAFHAKERKSNFYMVGSMGLVSSVGFGIALNAKKKIFIFDGDGSVLMDMGTMAMIASEQPTNLYHIILDNGSYQSTGGQPAISEAIDLSLVAKAVGYAGVAKISEMTQLQNVLKSIHAKKCPFFMLVKVDKGGLRDIPRVVPAPETLTQRVRGVLR